MEYRANPRQRYPGNACFEEMIIMFNTTATPSAARLMRNLGGFFSSRHFRDKMSRASGDIKDKGDIPFASQKPDTVYFFYRDK